MPEAKTHADTSHASGPPMLSQFEFDILRLMLDDNDIGQICAELNISPPTANIAIEAIMRGLKTRTVAGTAARAMRLGIIV